jgi:hypothetical protein
MTVKLNGTVYNVGVASVSRSLRREEKYRVTTEDGKTHREVRATYLDFSLELGSFGKTEYDRLLSFLHSTTDDITVELPRSATETESYTGVFDDITDEVISEDADGVLWDNLALSFTGTVPVEG